MCVTNRRKTDRCAGVPLQVVREAFLSGAEREISIGDEVEILVFRAGRSRPEIQRHPLPHH